MSYSTTVSTSVVLIPTANSNPPYFVYLNNVSTAGRIVTVRDNDGFASATNQIVIAPANGAFFQDGSTTITINQPYGYVTFTTALDGGYGVLNTFGFPTGSSAAFVSNITSSNLNTSSITATTLNGTTANFTTMNINTISTGNIIIQNFTPSSIVTNSVSTGTIQGGTLQFQTVTGSTIQTSNLQIPSLSTATGRFGTVTTFSTIVSTLAFTGDVTVHGAGTRAMVGTTRLIGTRSVAIGSNAGGGNDSVAIGISANASGTATEGVHIGIGAGSSTAANATVALGAYAGNITQQFGAVGVGYYAGFNNQQSYGIAIGAAAGNGNQQSSAVAIGVNSGNSTQGERSVAVGPNTGVSSQGARAIAIGSAAGNSSQGASSIAIGLAAGFSSQGANSIAIGSFAGQTSQHANTIILSASNSALNSDRTNAFYVAPIRDDQTGVGTRVAVYYNTATNEITTGPATGTNLVVSTVTTSTIQANSMTVAATLLASTIRANTVFTSSITNQTLISTASVVANSIQTTTFSTGTISIGVGNINTVNTNSLSTNSLSVGSLNVTTLSTGSILLGSASIGSIATNLLSTGTFTAQTGTISTFTAGSIVANTENVGTLNTNTLSTTTLTINGQTTMVNRQPLSIFVANGGDATTDLKYSLNGLNWSNALTNGNFTGVGKGVAWNGRIFIAVGIDSTVTATMRTSSNGIDWTNVVSGGFSTGGNGIAWNGQMWVATGEHSTSPGHIQYSFNGSNWFNANTTTFTTRANRVAWGNGRWIVTGTDAGGAANSIMTSTDGSNWSFVTNTTGASANFPAYNGQIWLMGATGVGSNAILYSSNGINWSRVDSTLFTTACYGLAWNGRQWVAVGQGGMTIQTSLNGMIWEPAQTNMFTLLDGAGSNVIWNGSVWLACGFDNTFSENRIKQSVDGLNWTNTSSSNTFDTAVNSVAFSSQVNPDLATQQLNIYSQNIPNVLQSTNQILALQSTLVLNNTLFVNNPANCVGVNASAPQVPLHVVGGWNGQASQIMLQTLGSTLNTSMYISTNVGQAILGVVGPSNGFMTNTVPGDTVLTTARTSNRLVLGNDASIGLFISSGTVVIPGTLAVGSAISTASITTGSASFSNITVARSTIVSTLFFTGDVSIQGATDDVRIGSNAGITGQGRATVAIGAAAGQTTQGVSAVAIGSNAGLTSQGVAAVAFGAGAGQTTQGLRAIAIGSNAGFTTQGTDAIAIGSAAGQTSQHANTIILNASGSALDSATTNAFYVAPIRNDQGITGERTMVYYNQTTKEITTGPTTNLVLSSLTVAGAVAFPSVSTNTLSTTTVNTVTLNVSGSAFVSSGLTLAGGIAYGSLQIRGGTSANATFIVDPGRTDNTGWIIGEDTNSAPISTFGITRVVAGSVQQQTGVFVASNGNVGVGISTPRNKLDVTGAIVTYSVAEDTVGILNPGNGQYLTIEAANRANSVKRPVLLNPFGGNVGVGSTATPAYTLDVTGTANVSFNKGYIRFTQWEGMVQDHGNSNGALFKWFNNNISGGGVTRDTYTLYAYPTTGGANQVMQVSTNAIVTFLSNVGVRTAPLYALDVNGQVWSRSTLYVGSSATGNEIRFNGTTGDAPGSFTHTVISERLYEAGTEKSELLFYKGNDSGASTAGPDRVRVLAAGGFQVDCGGTLSVTEWAQGGGAPPTATFSNALNVNGSNGFTGIGKIPSYQLDVNGTIAGLSTLTLGAAPGTAFNLQLDGSGQFGSPVSGRISYGTDGTGYQMRFSRRQGGTYRDIMTLTDNCNVGIGTTSPSARLQVLGETRITSNVASGEFRFRTGTDATLVEQITPSGVTYTTWAWSGASAANRQELYIYGNGSEGRVWGINSNRTMFFDSNVGFGTATPEATIDVRGRGRILQQGSSNTSQFGISNDTFCIQSACNEYQGGIASLFFGNNTTLYPLGRIYCQDAQTTVSGTYFSRMVFMVNTSNAFLTEAMRIDSNARVGIGLTAPSGILDVASNGFRYAVCRQRASDANAKTQLLGIGAESALWPVAFGNTLRLYWNGGPGTAYTNVITGSALFTGQHANEIVDSNITMSTLKDYVGLITSSADEGYVSYRGDGVRKTGSNAIWTTECLPKIKLTTEDKDPAVWGVITNHVSDKYGTDGNAILDDSEEWGNGLTNTVRVNGVGEGAIWVTNINGEFRNGDFICSSSIPGYGRRQDDDIHHSYTVAKITMSCKFELDQSNYRCEEFTHNGQTYRKAYVGCVYHCS